MVEKRLEDKEWLEEKYHVEGLNQSEIADLVGCDSSTVSRSMSRLDIKTRKGKPPVKYPELHNEEWVYEKYVEEYLTTGEIAEIVGCGRSHAIRSVSRHIPEDKIRSNGAQGNVLDTPLSSEMRQILEGELLGDGHIRNKYETDTAAFYYGTAKDGYRNWLYRRFQDEGFKTRTGNRYDKKYTQYRLETRNYRCLKDLRDSWYPSGEKTVPDGFEITPISLRHWYIGDGSRSEGGYVIYAYNFEGDQLQRLVDQLAENYIEATANNGVLRVRDAWVSDFFDYMAPPPPEVESVYGYKWPDNG